MIRPLGETLLLLSCGLVLLGVVLGAAAEPRMADIEVVCPLFGHQFTAQSVVGEQQLAGFDSDLCRRPRGISPYVLAVWTCPYCFFSAYQADFQGSLPPEYREMELRSYDVESATVEQTDIFVATKYLNAETYYRKAGKDARFLADLTLRGSYACRLSGPPEPNDFEPLRQALLGQVTDGKSRLSAEEVNLAMAELAQAALDAGTVPADRVSLQRYLLADTLRRGGSRIRAMEILDALVEDPGLSVTHRQNARDKAFLCRKEGEFQDRTLAYLRQAEEEGLIPEEEAAVVAYLQGELLRRLGRIDEARKQFERAAGIPSEESWLPTMIDRQTGRLAPIAPEPRAGRDAG